MTTTMTIAVTTALTVISLLRTIPIGSPRARISIGTRLQQVGPIVLALGVVVLATIGYLELVGVLVASLD